MQTIWDLLPASLWPTQPFVLPPDPTQPPAWPRPAPPSWTPSASNQSPFGWSATPGEPADVAPDPAASVSPWDSAVRQALVAQAGPPRDFDMRDMAHYDQMLDDAKRAHDFVRWVLGPSSLPQAPQTRDAALRGVSLLDGGDAARSVVATGGDARAILAGNSAAPVAASQMPTQGSDDAINSAASPSAPAGASYNPLTWTATENPLSWIQRQYEREHPERAAAMKRMADTRLGDVPAIDSPIIRRRMADGFAYGFGDEPIIQHQNIGPDTRIMAGGYELPDWAQPDARFLMRTANVVPQVLDLGLRSLRGIPPALAGFGAGLYQDMGGSEAQANRVQQDLGVLTQFPLTDLSLARPMAPAPRAPVRTLESNPLDAARKAPLAESDAPASAPRSAAGPGAAREDRIASEGGSVAAVAPPALPEPALPTVGLSATLRRLADAGRISGDEAATALGDVGELQAIRSAKVAAEVERLTVAEAKAILNSREFDKLRAAHDKGTSVVVHIGGRRIQYEPNFPPHFPGMADYEQNGFFIGPSAFTVPREAESTVLHELYRLNTTVAGAGDGFHSEAARFEGPAPHDFVKRVIESGKFDR